MLKNKPAMLHRKEFGGNWVPLQFLSFRHQGIVLDNLRYYQKSSTSWHAHYPDKMELKALTIIEFGHRLFLSMSIWTNHHQSENSSFFLFQQLITRKTPKPHCILDRVNIFIKPRLLWKVVFSGLLPNITSFK